MATDYVLPAYREGDETFSPMGDGNGLVIVVPVGRPWYPTGDALAAEWRLKLTWSADDGKTYAYPS